MRCTVEKLTPNLLARVRCAARRGAREGITDDLTCGWLRGRPSEIHADRLMREPFAPQEAEPPLRDAAEERREGRGREDPDVEHCLSQADMLI